MQLFVGRTLEETMMPPTETDFHHLHKRLEGATNTLHRFVLIYGNVGMDGARLTYADDVTEALLFETFLLACAELGIAPDRR
jgi:hypothetical protein